VLHGIRQQGENREQSPQTFLLAIHPKGPSFEGPKSEPAPPTLQFQIWNSNNLNRIAQHGTDKIVDVTSLCAREKVD
jgi:hypothetical protein